MAAFCTQCGSPVTEDDFFCPNCGSIIQKSPEEGKTVKVCENYLESISRSDLVSADEEKNIICYYRNECTTAKG